MTPVQEAHKYALGFWFAPDMTLQQVIEAAWMMGYLRANGSDQDVPGTTPELPGETEGWLKLEHVNGEHPCGGVAFYATQIPDPYAPAKLDILRIYAAPPHGPGEQPEPPRWRVPLPIDQPLCFTCGRGVHPYTNGDVNWKSVIGEPR